MIECYYFMIQEHRSEDDNYYCRSFFEQYLGKLDIVDMMLPLYEQSFGKLFLILCNDVELSRQWDDWISNIYYALGKYGDRLSISTLKSINRYGKLTNNKSICFEIEKMICQVPKVEIAVNDNKDGS